MSDLDILYERNQGFARTFDQGDLPILPRHPTIVLTCLAPSAWSLATPSPQHKTKRSGITRISLGEEA